MRAYEFVIGQQWAITDEALDTILAIAERKNEDPEAVAARIGKPLENARDVEVRDGVAIVPVMGPIARYANLFSEISGATSIDVLAKDFRRAVDDPKVRAIVLKVDSPGGTVAGVAQFAGHVFEARDPRKPIVAYVDSLAQSAGYWIASAADRVVVDPTAIVGSVGAVVGARVSPSSGALVKVKSEQSPLKQAEPNTEEGRALLQAQANSLAAVFIADVARNRGVDPSVVLSDFGRGASFVGQEAVAAGMADGVDSFEHVVACLSRGEMPCLPQKKPARKADTQTRRAAMSEPETISAAEAAELRRQLAELKARADEGEQVKERLAAVERDNAALKASNQSLEDARLAVEARAFADSVTKGPSATAFPAERPAIVRDYLRIASVDARLGETVTFADEKGQERKGSHLDAYKAGFALRPKTGVREEKVAARELAEEPDTQGAEAEKAKAEARQKANAEYAKSL